MCTLMSSLPKRSKSNGGNKSRNLVMTLKPCADANTYYRVRLLAFSPSASSGYDRDDPWIERYVHQKWGVNKEKGYPVLEDEIVCPVTPHVKIEGNRYDACKICTLANKYFLTFKESGWRDKEANKKNKEFGRKYQAVIPIYVVSNPNYDGDNNKFKVMIFNDRKFYQEFRKKVEQASTQNCVFNGKNAVDCCIHVKEEHEIVNQGQPNEYVFKKRVIDKVVFSTKPYDIPSINKDTVDNMGFDDEYYQTSSMDEIEMFYKKYCTISNDDIPMDDVPVYEEPVVQNKVNISNTEIRSSSVDLSDIDDLTSDPDDISLNPPVKNTKDEQKTTSSNDIDADQLLADLGL